MSGLNVMDAPQRTNEKRIVFLDYLRILAFTLVVIGHQFNKYFSLMAADAGTHITLRIIYSLIADASFGGAMGVVLFFLISGYIITFVIQKEMPAEFLIKRIFRIYPLYIFSVALELAFNYHSGKPPLGIAATIQQLLLIGDLFDTPLSLGQVEWTLRIEMLFYVLMFAFKSLGMVKNATLMTISLILITSALYFLGPIPHSYNFHNGYLSIFAPFLFIGVIIFYLERRMVNTSFAALTILFLFYTHLCMAEKFTPTWIRFNYSIVGMSIFVFSLTFKDKFKVTAWSSFLSEITYAIYLMHKWAWDTLNDIASNFRVYFIPNSIITVFLLILTCYILHVTIERGGIKAGRKIAGLIRR